MNSFWKKFDELMSSIPDYIEEQTSKISKSNSVIQSSSGSKSVSTIVQGGKKIVIKTVDGKTTVTVNGKEYVEK